MTLAALAVLLPTVAAALSALRHPYVPAGDWALIELKVRDVGSSDTPLVGVYSRYGWRHPGPLLFYALALPYRLVPADRGLLFAAAVLNFAAIAGFVALLVRRPRFQALTAFVGLAVVQRGLGVKELGDPWNPTIAVMPFALFLALCLEHATTRRCWTLPALVALGSFLVQCHVGFAHPVLLVGGAALAFRWWQTRSEPAAVTALATSVGAAAATDVEDEEAEAKEKEVEGTAEGSPPSRLRRWLNPLGVSTLVALVAWLPPLLEQFFGDGNLVTLVRWAAGDDSLGNGTTTGNPAGKDWSTAAAWLLDPTGLWVGRFKPLTYYGVQLFNREPAWKLLWIPVVLALIAAVVLHRRDRICQHKDVMALFVLGAAGVLATFTGLWTVRGIPVFHPFRWASLVVMVLFLALAWAILGVLARRPAGLRRWAPLVAGALVLAVAGPTVATVWGGTAGVQPGQPNMSGALLRLQPAIEEAGRSEGTVVAECGNGFKKASMGLVVLLEREGIDWVEPYEEAALGKRWLDIATIDETEGLLGVGIHLGRVEVLQQSGWPRPGEKHPELMLLLSNPVEEVAPRTEQAIDCR